MMEQKVVLVPLSPDDREQFTLDNQRAFRYGASVGPGELCGQVDVGEVISRDTIECCMDEVDSEAYRIMFDGRKVGGVILKINRETNYNFLELFFVHPEEHSKGIGYDAWLAVESLYPETAVWETCTPYFEKRNIHFYMNKCGFQAVEFFNAYNIGPEFPCEQGSPDKGPDEMFRFTKVMK